jgi:hypothetical protein
VPSTFPIELRYSTGKLVKSTIIGGIFVVVAGRIVMSGGLGSDYHGRDSTLMHLLGPRGTQIFFAMFGFGCLVMFLAYLRLLITPSRLAVSATADALSINGIWARKRLRWQAINMIELHTATAWSREFHSIKVIATGRRDILIDVNILSGGLSAAEDWIRNVQPLRDHAAEAEVAKQG